MSKQVPSEPKVLSPRPWVIDVGWADISLVGRGGITNKCLELIDRPLHTAFWFLSSAKQVKSPHKCQKIG